MNRQFWKYAGLFLIADGILSVFFLGAWDLQFANIIRYIRAIIGLLLWWSNR